MSEFSIGERVQVPVAFGMSIGQIMRFDTNRHTAIVRLESGLGQVSRGLDELRKLNGHP